MSSDPIAKLGPDVRLEPLGPQHASNMFRWMCDPEVSTNLGLRSEPSLEKTQLWIANALESREIRGFAILSAGNHVGNLIFDRLDEYLSSARLSIYIGEPEARGSGVGSRALRMGVEKAFKELSLNKIWLIVHVQNNPAIRTYLKTGFVMEGILRDEFRLNGKLVAAFYMGLLRDEFEHKQAIRA